MLDQSSADALYNIAEEYLNCKDYRNAVDRYLRSYDQEPSAITANNISHCYYMLLNDPKALFWIQEALILDGSSAIIYYNYAVQLDVLNSGTYWKEISEALLNAAELNPSFVDDDTDGLYKKYFRPEDIRRLKPKSSIPFLLLATAIGAGVANISSKNTKSKINKLYDIQR